ncbi:MAG TPA: DUF892 family protein [Dysgonamonadaceae bacterium]|nr:DUF892 family protein [Dysgonamonadaceae bacterium]
MNNLADLFNSEFKNLYSLEKECAEVFNDVQGKIEDQDLQQIAVNLSTECKKQSDLIQQALQGKAIDLKGTKDAVAEAMIDNLREISTKDIPQEVKDEGLLASFNRLNYYRMACYENTYELTKKLGYDELRDLLYYEV